MEDDDSSPSPLGTARRLRLPERVHPRPPAPAQHPVPGARCVRPGEAQGNFALESAIDELAYALGIDPLELRLRNYAEIHPQLGLPWSSKALRECFEVGAERFGWSARDPEPRLDARRPTGCVGYGVAGVSYPWYAGAAARPG